MRKNQSIIGAAKKVSNRKSSRGNRNKGRAVPISDEEALLREATLMLNRVYR
jgi:hypothetical protein